MHFESNIHLICLATFEIEVAEINALAPEEQKALIRKQYKKLALRCHPDKNPDNPATEEAFKAVRRIYDELMASFEQDNLEENPPLNSTIHFKKGDVQVSAAAFDSSLRKSIIEAAEELRAQYPDLNEEEKEAFDDLYADFFKLAEYIKNTEEHFADEVLTPAVKAYQWRSIAPTLESFRLEWRESMLRLFAEEYLDDLTYREALRSGNLWPILAARKLISPIKLFAALMHTLNQCLIVGLKLFVFGPVFYVADKFKDYEPGFFLALLAISLGALYVAGLLSLFIAAIDLAPMALLYLVGLPVITRLLELMASPFNTLIRPTAQLTGLSPLNLILLGGGSALLLAATLGSIAFLTLATGALHLYRWYVLAQRIHGMSAKKDPGGDFILVMEFCLLEFFNPLVAINLFLELSFSEAMLSVFIIQCFLTFLLSWVVELVNFFDNLEALPQEKTTFLPLPREEIPDLLKEVTQSGHTKAVYSDRFFNTGKEAKVLGEKERGFSQTFTSFFAARAEGERPDDSSQDESYDMDERNSICGLD